MPLLSVFAPSSIKVSFGYQQSINCTVTTPRNLSTLRTSNLTEYWVQTNAVFLSETYFPPANPCGDTFESQCSYGMDFVGPGFDCKDVTASSNYSAFQETPAPLALLPGESSPEVFDDILWFSSMAGDDENPTMRLSVQTWDVSQSIYRATNCTSVMRRYSLLITHGSSSTIEVTNSTTLSHILMEPGSNLSTWPYLSDTLATVPFVQQYAFYAMWILVGNYAIEEFGGNIWSIFRFPNLLGSLSQVVEDEEQTISWNKNMPDALEQYAQNVTLSILSGQIFTLTSPDGPDLVEDSPTTCIYTYTAYEYTPWRLLSSYGVAIAVTIVCVAAGFHAIKQNGVEESMAFSRLLQAVLNERMFNVREKLDKNSVIKADDDEEGSFAPFLEPVI